MSRPSSYLTNQCYEETVEFGLKPTANCEFSEIDPITQNEIQYRYNSMGIRDREYSARSKGGNRRILLLGTFLDGFGRPESELPSRQLERNLNSHGVKDVEVINGSISGFYTGRSLRLGLKLIQDYRPDLVIYYLSEFMLVADFQDTREMTGQRFDNPWSATNAPWWAKLFWKDDPIRQALWSGARRRLVALKNQGVSDLTSPILESLREFKDSCRKNNCKFLVSYGSGYPLYPHYGLRLEWPWREILGTMMPSEPIPKLDLKSKMENTGIDFVELPLPFRDPWREGLHMPYRFDSLSPVGVKLWINAMLKPIMDHFDTK